MSNVFHQEQAKALLELLRSAHAVQYTGLDDEMPDDCNDWIESLSDDEICELVLAVYHEGL
jgi:hypothetical protein